LLQLTRRATLSISAAARFRGLAAPAYPDTQWPCAGPAIRRAAGCPLTWPALPIGRPVALRCSQRGPRANAANIRQHGGAPGTTAVLCVLTTRRPWNGLSTAGLVLHRRSQVGSLSVRQGPAQAEIKRRVGLLLQACPTAIQGGAARGIRGNQSFLRLLARRHDAEAAHTARVPTRRRPSWHQSARVSNVRRLSSAKCR